MGEAAVTPEAARERFMREAIGMARRSLAAGGPPVGAVLVRRGELLASAQNEVVAALDVTAHAEIQLIRSACKSLRTLSLEGCELYVTVEPCAMCAAASLYAGIERIVFGAPISAMELRTGREAHAPDEMAAPARLGGVMLDECLALFDEWPYTTARAREGER